MIEVSDYELILSARLFVLQRAIGALIVTHPDPARFAEIFEAVSDIAHIEHLLVPKATEAVRAEARRFAQDLVDLARDEALRRGQAPPAG